jgi:hypothetical protein
MASVRITQEQYKKMLAGSELVQQEGKEIPVRLELVQKTRLRWAHWALLAWAIAAGVSSGVWLSLPTWLLLVIGLVDIMRTRVYLQQLVEGLERAGVLQGEEKSDG